MIRKVLTTVLVAGALLPASASAGDGEIARLGLRHLNGTGAVLTCTDNVACAKAFTVEVRALSAISKRATARLMLLNNGTCLRASRKYLTAGRSELRAAQNWIMAPTTTNHARFYLAVTRVNDTLVPLARAC